MGFRLRMIHCQTLMSRLLDVAHPTRKLYPSDMSDAEWAIIEPKLPSPKGFGHPREVNLREILNAIFYVQRTGCQWEMLPHDFPPHQTVYKYFRKWHAKPFGKRCMMNYGANSATT